MASTGSFRKQYSSQLSKMKLFLVLLVFCTSSSHSFSVERIQRQRNETLTVGEIAFREWTDKKCMFPTPEFQKVFLDACDSVYEVDTDMSPITPICELFHEQSMSLCNEPVQLQLGASTSEDLCHSFSELRDEIAKERTKYLGLFLLSDNEDMCKRVCDEEHLLVCDGVFRLLQNRDIRIVPENVHQSRNLFADTEAEEAEAGHGPQEDPEADNPQQGEAAGSLPQEETVQGDETGGNLPQEETGEGLQKDETGGSLHQEETGEGLLKDEVAEYAETGGSPQQDKTGGDVPQEETVQETEKDVDNPGQEENAEADKDPDDATENKELTANQEEGENAAETKDDDAKGEELTGDGGPGGIEEVQSVDKRGPDPEDGKPIEETRLGEGAVAGQETAGQPIGEGDKTGPGEETAIGQETAGQPIGEGDKTGPGEGAAIGQETAGQQPIGEGDKTGLGEETAIGQETAGQPIGEGDKTGPGEGAAIGQETAGQQPIGEGDKTGLGEGAAIGQETGGQEDTGPENQLLPPNFEEGVEGEEEAREEIEEEEDEDDDDEEDTYPDEPRDEEEEMVNEGDLNEDREEGEYDGDVYGNEDDEDDNYDNEHIITNHDYNDDGEDDESFFKHDDGDTIAGGGSDWAGEGGHPHGNDQAQLKEDLGAQANIYDLDDEPKQGHFMAYFVTFCVLIVLGYVTYHNRQKIIAIIIEGRAGLRDRKSRRPSGGGYRRLDQNVSEAMPSIKNAVF